MTTIRAVNGQVVLMATDTGRVETRNLQTRSVGASPPPEPAMPTPTEMNTPYAWMPN